MIEMLVPKTMDLAVKDDEFNHLQRKIKEKREFLKNKQQKVKKISKTNEFLEAVNEDYAKYYSYIIQQENEKMGALGTLRNYVRDLSASGALSEQNMIDAKEEQKKIINEMKLIKKKIDDIIGKNKQLLELKK
jgi:uncharacterized membrane-anchored protein YhcB (DUF1043 family)